MKPYLVNVFILFGVFFSVSLQAQSPLIDLELIRSELIEQIADRHSVDAEKLRLMMRTLEKDTAQQEDLLTVMLSLPKHKRQYHYPRLNESVYFSKKVRTHPLILAYKGKKPTVIPPVLKAWADTYLDDLPAEYYPVLDPDLWQIPMADSNNAQTSISKNMLISRPFGYRFPDVTSFYTLSPELRENYKKTTLTPAHVQNMTPMFHGLAGLYAAQKHPIEFKNALNVLTYLQKKKTELSVHPFKTRINQLILLGFENDLNKLAQHHGYQSARDFAEKADKILKAWRASSLQPHMAAGIKKQQSQTPKIPWDSRDTPIADIHAYAALYEAPPGDIYFIEPYVNDLKNMFNSPVFQSLQLFTPLDS